MLVGDFLDAMAGYNEGESERIKGIAELIRTSTYLLWNTQVDNKITPDELWPFSWDKNEEKKIEAISEEEAARRQKAQDDYLMKK